MERPVPLQEGTRLRKNEVKSSLSIALSKSQPHPIGCGWFDSNHRLSLSIMSWVTVDSGVIPGWKSR